VPGKAVEPVDAQLDDVLPHRGLMRRGADATLANVGEHNGRFRDEETLTSRYVACPSR
jgi:hypothetical protein